MGDPSDKSDGEDSAGGAAGVVTVLFFANAREAAGVARATPAAAGNTVRQLVMQLRSRYGPDFDALMTSCAIWVNGLPSQPGTVLRAGDEVAVLPPVSGG